VELDASGWSGEGAFTQLLVDALRERSDVQFVRVEDAPASRADAGFTFISNEIFVRFATAGAFARLVRREPPMTLDRLHAALSAADAIGPADYADEGMLQYLRAERVVAPYQTRGVKVVEMVRVYEAGTPRRA
jgi:hypothetical protein